MSLRIAVVIPTLNEGEYIGQCLQSLKTYAGQVVDQIVVVDAGSTDETVAIARKAGVTVVVQSRSTIADQRNRGAETAGDAGVFAFLDADCTVEPGWAESALAHFEDPEVVSVGAPPGVPSEDTSWVQDVWCFLKWKPQAAVREVSWLASANVWVRRSSFDAVGGFDPSLETCEDADLGFRLAQTGKILSDPAIKVRHHREPRTLRAFFQKEVWHGKHSYDGLLSGRITPAELPSLLTPIICGVSTLGLLIGILSWPWWGGWLAILSVAGMLLSPVAYTLRAHVSKSKWSLLPKVFIVYVVYFAARTVAAFVALKRALFRPKQVKEIK